jgi:Immunity protein Imm1
MAVGPEPDAEGEISFLAGGTLSPVPRRYALRHDDMVSIAEAFVRNGERKADVTWEEI